MFRNPRENADPQIETPIKPSTGRAPTPPNGVSSEHKIPSATSTRVSSTKPLTPRPNSKSNLPTLGRKGTKQVAPSRTPAKTAFKAGKPNASILSFFKKVDGPVNGAIDGDLFIQSSQEIGSPPAARSPSIGLFGDEEGTDIYGDTGSSSEDEARYNENAGAVKRRKISCDGSPARVDVSEDNAAKAVATENGEALPQEEGACTPPPPDATDVKKPAPRRIGAFVDDSDSEEEEPSDETVLGRDRAVQHIATAAEEFALKASRSGYGDNNDEMVDTTDIKQEDIVLNAPVVPEVAYVGAIDTDSNEVPAVSDEALSTMEESDGPPPNVPQLKKEETSYSGFENYEDLDDFDGDEFVEGEEYIERKWMQEQARLEAMEMDSENPGDYFNSTNGDDEQEIDVNMEEACPICSATLGGISAEDVSRHVNACLDGKPIPLPSPIKKEEKDTKLMPPNANTRFSRSAIPRPGQANPFSFGATEAKSTSAFSKIMSSKAEDAAWASAAAAEQSSRGKPAYQRTCPFYKIMPGFFICVDAFRYGAVEGCKAYFLSHFHSDHYIGLTKQWCHGPIFCSKVTGNLVMQQLKVDPKWVVQIDFEKRLEVPGTQGVTITMIPANHCPGSSLFLFEKVIGKGPSPKVQRVLHCGDFRACPAHIAHPLLMPDIVDSITGRTKQQKIDVCYLDTTYLNPRYAFPSQEDVIKSCADMCVSLSKDRAEQGDAWELVKRERAGAGMAKFVDSSKIKEEDESIAMTTKASEKARGRLLVVCGTYSIGKERICMGIARALDCKIWAAPGKQRICAALEDPELMSRMTDDPNEAQIHMQMLMEIRAETLQDYLNGFKPHFSRVVGFRPSGWNYRPPNSRFVDSPLISTVLNSDNWRSRYHMSELVPQRGSTKEASCFGVPYSEHSSFRELTMFCCALRIEKIIPTVNVGSAPGRAKMKAWIERWLAERRKNGPIKIGHGDGEVKW